ncbi:MAG: DNA-binding protein [Candidatus Diapherotrites archaeon]|uniref:DNA-binding protein n=1 Tax=Candidatus Iainarchaeum sp. TaxID=3101447 RepID=A0A2D6LP93_9ARCH|nr:DNA-binding protein [Candidatus Diapherotrites archaeon]|tara:strand:+ start:5387 stop:5815 length:429 start_codon:yes stop_codon:yes gene_type:complete
MGLQSKGLSSTSEDSPLTRHEQVAFDTNMLLNIARFNVDVFQETKKMLGNVEFMIPKQVMQELDKLAEHGQSLRKEVNVAKMAIENNNVKIIEVKGMDADEALEKMASEVIIATNDKELKDSVREMNGRVLYLRQKKFLEMA